MAGRMLLGVVVRAAALVLVIAGWAAVLNNSDTTDALSAGLLAFFLLVGFAFVWSLVDGIRQGFVVATVLWLLTSAVAGIGIPTAIAIVNDSAITDELGESGLFFGLLLFLPALAGVAVGGLVHRIRGRDEVVAAG
ncbi:hypothetical protein [Nocardioides sp. SR21]|uniref:hypothetical protein n=1 Tax=Nocardioides sp. SR21 TaxID=2919501 RepID=UPI001FAB1E7F|nr:hypothetical protein [Nocardioides sp. SR21]